MHVMNISHVLKTLLFKADMYEGGSKFPATIFFLFTWVHLYKSGSIYIKYEPFSRAAKAIHCAKNVKTVRLCTEFNKSINNIF